MGESGKPTRQNYRNYGPERPGTTGTMAYSDISFHKQRKSNQTQACNLLHGTCASKCSCTIKGPHARDPPPPPPPFAHARTPHHHPPPCASKCSCWDCWTAELNSVMSIPKYFYNWTKLKQRLHLGILFVGRDIDML